jgi:uncharacterized membrane protein YoaK (UPF0700 family)
LLLLSWKGARADARLLLLILAVLLGVQNGAFRFIGGFHLNTTFVTGDLELLGEAIVDRLNTMPKVTAFLLSWVGYLSGGLLGALATQVIPDHAFLLSTVLAVMSTFALALMPGSRPAQSHS